MPTWISFLLLCLLTSIHAAFTGTTCDANYLYCIQRNGSVCFYANVSSSLWGCSAPFQLPLEAHLKQNYSIGHYSASGQHLGGSDFSLVGSTPPVYACMSARVNITSAAYTTLCAVVVGDNSWQGGGCVVNVVPANVVDGCYTGPDTTSTTSTTSTRIITTISAVDSQLGGPTSAFSSGSPIVTFVPGLLPSAGTNIKRNLLKDSGYSVIWALTIFLTMMVMLIYRDID